ncbi:unnamed protein product [Musa banksii]
MAETRALKALVYGEGDPHRPVPNHQERLRSPPLLQVLPPTPPPSINSNPSVVSRPFRSQNESSEDVRSWRRRTTSPSSKPSRTPAIASVVAGLVFGVVGAMKDDKEEEEVEGEAEMDGDESTPPLLLATLGPRAPAPGDRYCCKSWTN